MPISRRDGLKLTGMFGALAAGGAAFRTAGAAPIPVGTPETDTQPKEGGEWIMAISELPDTLDPHKTGAAIASTILGYAGNALVSKDFDGNYMAGLATEWEISEDGLTWTFQIRQDVTFHDGTPLDANAVKFSFDRILDPATTSITAAGLLGPMESTAAPDASTFSFTLSEPFSPLLDNLTASTLSIVSPTAVESMGDEFGRTPVLTGPWMVDEWRTGDRIILKKNPDYRWAPPFLHQDGPAYIETLTFQSIIEEASRIAAFEAGEIHQVTLPPTDVERISTGGDSWVIEYLRKGVVFVEFNVTKAPFDDVLVRRAFNHAINKQDVLDTAIEGLGQIAYGFLSPTIPGYWPEMEQYAPAFDPAQATALLTEAGWVANDDGRLEKDGQAFEFTLLNLPTDAWNRGAQVIQSQLDDIGISMEIQQMEFATLLEEAKAKNHDAEMMGYTYSDPDIAFLWFHSSNAGAGLNMSHVNDPVLDEMIIRGRSTIDPTERAAVYAEMQQYVSDLALWVPLWSDQYFVAFNKSIHNANFHPDNYTVFFDAWID